MTYTLSVQNGSQCNRSHNIRSEKTVTKEDHINPDGRAEIWYDERERDAYRRLFGISVDNYNARQTRKSRKIASYYNQIKHSSYQHTAYEIIITVGNRDNKPDDETGRRIMKEYCDSWKRRNPTLELIGAYYHADEFDPETGQPSAPHVHIDYIPVAEGYKNGMEKRTALNRALESLGFYKRGKETPQIQWQRSERRALESICRDIGVEYEPERESARRHFSKETYIAHQELLRKREEVKSAGNELLQKEQKSVILSRHIDEQNARISQIGLELDRQKKEHQKREEAIQKIQKLHEGYENALQVPVRKTLLGGDRADISVKDLQDLRTAVITLKNENEALKEKNNALRQQSKVLSDRTESLSKNVRDLQKQVSTMRTLNAWNSEYGEKIKAVLENNPELDEAVRRAAESVNDKGEYNVPDRTEEKEKHV